MLRFLSTAVAALILAGCSAVPLPAKVAALESTEFCDKCLHGYKVYQDTKTQEACKKDCSIMGCTTECKDESIFCTGKCQTVKDILEDKDGAMACTKSNCLDDVLGKKSSNPYQSSSKEEFCDKCHSLYKMSKDEKTKAKCQASCSIAGCSENCHDESSLCVSICTPMVNALTDEGTLDACMQSTCLDGPSDGHSHPEPDHGHSNPYNPDSSGEFCDKCHKIYQMSQDLGTKDACKKSCSIAGCSESCTDDQPFCQDTCKKMFEALTDTGTVKACMQSTCFDQGGGASDPYGYSPTSGYNPEAPLCDKCSLIQQLSQDEGTKTACKISCSVAGCHSGCSDGTPFCTDTCKTLIDALGDEGAKEACKTAQCQ